MASADMTRLMNNARIHLTGALDPTMQLELFNAVSDFLKRSNIWKEDITLNVTSGVTSYDVSPTDTGFTNRLMWVVNSNGLPVEATMQVPPTLVLRYAPTAADTYTATVSKSVTDPTTRDGYPDFPDWILNKYYDDLLNGLLGRMMAQPAKPYMNQQLAIYYLKKFNSGISQARAEAAHQNLYGGQTWRFPRTFRR